MPGIQSRRFLVSAFSDLPIVECWARLKSDVSVRYVCKDSSRIYFETTSRKTVNGIKTSFPFLGSSIENVRYNIILLETHYEETGKPMTKVDRPGESTKITPESVYHHVLFYKEPPEDFDDVYLPRKVRMECLGQISAAYAKLERDEYELDLLPWQRLALQILKDQKKEEILWIFDMDGGSGKSEFGKYLKNKEKFQYIISESARDVAGMLRPHAKGYCIDVVRVGDKQGSKFNSLSEQITNQNIFSGKFFGFEVTTSSPTICVLSNFMPNLAALSMRRWVILHPKLGLVNLNCDPYGGLGYKCSISKNMTNSVVDKSAPWCGIELTDADLYKQYLECHCVGLEFLYRNRLAFPAISGAHSRAVYSLINKREYRKLVSYIISHNLLRDSIASTTDFIGCEPYSSSEDSSSDGNFSFEIHIFHAHIFFYVF